MESNALPGSILVSENTYKLVKNYFDLDGLGEIEVKGKTEPQTAYELKKTGDVITRMDAAIAKGLTRFVGRRNSMGALVKTFTKAKSGSGQILGIVGKSRLLLEIRNTLNQDEFNYLEGRCLHYGGSMAYLPIIDIINA